MQVVCIHTLNSVFKQDTALVKEVPLLLCSSAKIPLEQQTLYGTSTVYKTLWQLQVPFQPFPLHKTLAYIIWIQSARPALGWLHRRF